MVEMGFTNATTAEVINATNSSAEEIGIYGLETGNRVNDLFVESVFGSPEITGLVFLVAAEFAMLRNGTHEAVQISLIVPSLIMLGNFGYLPFGEGVIYGVLLSVAFVVSVFVLKYFET